MSAESPDLFAAHGSPGQPTVGVVIATHNRPQQVRAAITSVLDQDYEGAVEVVVVFDQSEPDLTLECIAPGRTVRVVRNVRTPGLAGARNTGIETLQCCYVAFCDDDDVWLPGKLTAQVQLLESRPTAAFCTTAMTVTWQGQTTDRLAGVDEVTVEHLSRSRMAMLHSSSFLFRRDAAVHGFGLVDETLPRSMAEDWDLLLRAARLAPIAHLDVPYVLVMWGATSYFNDAWFDRNEAHQWLIDHHPEFLASKVGAGLMLGKLAFGNAAVGRRRVALGHARNALRANWREPRAYLALAVTAGVPARIVTETLNKRGHGV